MKSYYYRPQTKLLKGNVLHLSVSHSVHRGCLLQCMLGYMPLGRQPPPPGQTHPTPGRHPPRQTSPWTDTPLGRHPLGRHPLLDRPLPWADGHCSRRYTSYWNAFLFGQICPQNWMEMKEIGQGGTRPCPLGFANLLTT